MSAVDVIFDQNEIQRNTNIILEAATEEQAKAYQQSCQIIIKTAQVLIQKYQIMLELIYNFESSMKQTIKKWNALKTSLFKDDESFKESTYYDQYLKERANNRIKYFSNQIKQEILNTYKLAMEFQQYLNAVLGQKVETAYVWTGVDKIPETYVINDMSDFLKVDIDSSGNVVVRYKDNVTMLRQHAEKVEASIKENPDFNYSLLKSTYKTIYDRFTKYKKRGGSSLVLWLYPYGGQKWNGVFVSSFGSINEAYATLLLHQHFNATNIPEDNIEQFMNNVMKVTNLSGTLQGDTTVNNMQLAIKSSQATTLSIKQLYEIAQNIVQNKINNFQAIKNYLIEKKKQNKQAEHNINISLKEILQNIANETIGQAIQAITG